MKVGIYDTIESKLVYTFTASSLNKKSGYTEPKYKYFEIDPQNYAEAYYYDDQSDVMLVDANYQPPTEPIEDIVKTSIINAMRFGNNLTVEFATENVLMGITQANKTGEVSDYLTNLTRYIQTGSLYEAVNEIDRLLAGTLPSELSPFVTTTRLENFKQKILDYLT